MTSVSTSRDRDVDSHRRAASSSAWLTAVTACGVTIAITSGPARRGTARPLSCTHSWPARGPVDAVAQRPHVRLARLLLAEPGLLHRIDQPYRRLADLGSQLTTPLSHRLVLRESAVDRVGELAPDARVGV